MNEERLIDLETKLSFQEVLIDDLQKTVNEQYKTIEEMEKKLRRISDKILAAEQSTKLSHEKPPHY